MLHDIDFLGVGLMSGIDNKIESFFEIDYKFSLLKIWEKFLVCSRRYTLWAKICLRSHSMGYVNGLKKKKK